MHMFLLHLMQMQVSGCRHYNHGVLSETDDETSSYTLTSSVSYLVNRLGVRLRDMFAEQLAEHRLTVPAYRVLAALRQQGDQRLSDLAERTAIEQSTLSRLVSSLQRNGLVSRTRPQDNARTIAVNLTDEGRELVDILIPLAVEHERTITESLSHVELEEFKRVLRVMYDSLDEAGRDRS